MPDVTVDKTDRLTGDKGKKVVTNDRPVTIVTTSGDYQGNINLNFSSVQINRVSDLFVKSNISFLPLYNATVKGRKGKEVLINIRDIAVVIPHDSIFPPARNSAKTPWCR